MTTHIQPPSETVSKILEKFRKDIANNQFKISGHASKRMIDRKISIREVLEAVRLGVLGAGDRREGFIGGRFILDDLTVIVYVPYGDHGALPVIVTVYREGAPDLEYAVGELTAPSITELSDDELQQELERRRAARSEAERVKRERERSRLLTRRIELENELRTVVDRLDELDLLYRLEDLK